MSLCVVNYTYCTYLLINGSSKLRIIHVYPQITHFINLNAASIDNNWIVQYNNNYLHRTYCRTDRAKWRQATRHSQTDDKANSTTRAKIREQETGLGFVLSEYLKPLNKKIFRDKLNDRTISTDDKRANPTVCHVWTCCTVTTNAQHFGRQRGGTRGVGWRLWAGTQIIKHPFIQMLVWGIITAYIGSREISIQKTPPRAIEQVKQCTR